MPGDEHFGCDSCWPQGAEAGAVWARRGELSRGARLVDESHFGVSMLTCPGCGQRFVSVFTETIDWADGDDPQYVSIMPLSAAEAEELSSACGPGIESRLNELAPERRSLRGDYPKGAPKRTYWGTGIGVGPHD